MQEAGASAGTWQTVLPTSPGASTAYSGIVGHAGIPGNILLSTPAVVISGALKRAPADPVASLRELVEATTREVRGLAAQVGRGELSPAAFGDEMASLLEGAHTRAVYLGRLHAGDTAPPEQDDRRFAERIVDGEAEFLAGFVRDLQEGRYEGSPDAVAARAELYAHRLTGTATEVWCLAGDDDTLYDWVLGAPEYGHCDDCPRIAAAGPYRLADLPTYPGAGGTTCATRCLCVLVRSDGARGFQAQ